MKTTYEIKIENHIVTVKYNDKTGKHVLIVDGWYYVIVAKKRHLESKFEALKKMILTKQLPKKAA